MILKTYYYGLYRYSDMKTPKPYLVSCKDAIPCTALHPIFSAVSFTKKNIRDRVKETTNRLLLEWGGMK